MGRLCSVLMFVGSISLSGCDKPASDNTCIYDADCEPQSCTDSGSCIDGRCEYDYSRCCEDLWDCDDGDPCTVDDCDDDRRECFHNPIDGCVAECDEDSDCDDGDACTRDECGDGVCTITAIPKCGVPCTDPEDCDDGDDCTEDWCAEGICTNTAIPNCGEGCEDAAECDDADNCTEDDCIDGTCTNTAIPDCTPCDGSGTCDAEETCDCADCAAEPGCGNPGCATEITVVGDIAVFGSTFEGAISQIGEVALEDIIQGFFVDDLAPGSYPLSAPEDHMDCFDGGWQPGCVQVRGDFQVNGSEWMATAGNLTIDSGPPYAGSLDSVVLTEYTQEDNIITLGVECLWLASASFE